MGKRNQIEKGTSSSDGIAVQSAFLFIAKASVVLSETSVFPIQEAARRGDSESVGKCLIMNVELFCSRFLSFWLRLSACVVFDWVMAMKVRITNRFLQNQDKIIEKIKPRLRSVWSRNPYKTKDSSLIYRYVFTGGDSWKCLLDGARTARFRLGRLPRVAACKGCLS